jgi:hypothetical protein
VWHNVVLLQALYLAFVNNVDYETEFDCHDELKTFLDFMKSEGGQLNRSVTISKKSIKTSWMPLNFFEPKLRKKLIKLVSKLLFNFQQSSS